MFVTQFIGRVVYSHGGEEIKSFSEPLAMRAHVESWWLDEAIDDASWNRLLKNEKLSFFGDRTIEIELVNE